MNCSNRDIIIVITLDHSEGLSIFIYIIEKKKKDRSHLQLYEVLKLICLWTYMQLIECNLKSNDVDIMFSVTVLMCLSAQG